MYDKAFQSQKVHLQHYSSYMVHLPRYFVLILLCLSVQITLAVGVSQTQMTVHPLLVRTEANVRI